MIFDEIRDQIKKIWVKKSDSDARSRSALDSGVVNSIHN